VQRIALLKNRILLRIIMLERTDPMNKERLLAFLKAYPAASFSEIECFFDEIGFDYHGEQCIESVRGTNVMFWTGWSREASRMICELVEEKRIGITPVSPFIALTFKKQFALPMARQPDHNYKTLHWCPAVVTFLNQKEVHT